METKKSHYQLTRKRLIALILIVTFSFTTISPVYASRAGNFGESSAFSQTISGAYSGAQLSSDFGSGAFLGMVSTVGVAAVDLWYYVNYYSDYGKTLISFDVGGTRVDISRGQMVRMVGSVAVNSMIGLARGGFMDPGAWVASVAKEAVNQFVNLIVQETIRDVLVRKFGMDPNFAGIISGIAAQLLSNFISGDKILSFLKQIYNATLTDKYSETDQEYSVVEGSDESAKSGETGNQPSEPAQGPSDKGKETAPAAKEGSEAKSGKTGATEGRDQIRVRSAGASSSKKPQEAKLKEINDAASYMIKTQATTGLDKGGRLTKGIFTRGELQQGKKYQEKVRENIRSQIRALDRNPLMLPVARRHEKARLEAALKANDDYIGMLDSLDSQLASGEAPVLSEGTMNSIVKSVESGEKVYGKRLLPTLIQNLVVKSFVGAVGVVSPKAGERAREALKPKPAEVYEFAEQSRTKDAVVVVQNDRGDQVRLTDGGKPIGKAEDIKDGRVLSGDDGQKWKAVVSPGGGKPTFVPLGRPDSVLTRPDLGVIDQVKKGQRFNDIPNNRVMEVDKVSPEGKPTFKVVPGLAPEIRSFKLQDGSVYTRPDNGVIDKYKVGDRFVNRDNNQVMEVVNVSSEGRATFKPVIEGAPAGQGSNPGVTLTTTFTSADPDVKPEVGDVLSLGPEGRPYSVAGVDSRGAVTALGAAYEGAERRPSDNPLETKVKIAGVVGPINEAVRSSEAAGQPVDKSLEGVKVQTTEGVGRDGVPERRATYTVPGAEPMGYGEIDISGRRELIEVNPPARAEATKAEIPRVESPASGDDIMKPQTNNLVIPPVDTAAPVEKVEAPVHVYYSSNGNNPDGSPKFDIMSPKEYVTQDSTNNYRFNEESYKRELIDQSLQKGDNWAIGLVRHMPSSWQEKVLSNYLPEDGLEHARSVRTDDFKALEARGAQLPQIAELRSFIDSLPATNTYEQNEAAVYSKVQAMVVSDQSVQYNKSNTQKGEFHNVLDSLQDGRGVCRDKSAVLEYGLEYLGYKTGVPIQVDSVFNATHMWVRVQGPTSTYDFEPLGIQEPVRLPPRDVLPGQVLHNDHNFSK